MTQRTMPLLLSFLPLALALSMATGHAQSPQADPAATAPASTAVDAQPTRPSRQYPIKEFIEAVGVSGASFSADESRILFSSNKTGVWNAYSMAVSGGEWTPVTRSATDNNYAVAYFPTDDRALVTRDQGGNELDHLYVIGKDGKARDLTPGDNLKAEFAGFSHDSNSFWLFVETCG